MLNYIPMDSHTLSVTNVNSCISQGCLAKFFSFIYWWTISKALAHCHCLPHLTKKLLFQVSKKILKTTFTCLLLKNLFWNHNRKTLTYLLMNLVYEVAVLKCLVSVCVEHLLFNIAGWYLASSKLLHL